MRRMARAEWTVRVGGRDARIALEHGYWSGKRRIFVDGVEQQLPASERVRVIDFGSVHRLALEGTLCDVVVRTNGLWFTYDLIVDGVSRSTGARASAPPDRSIVAPRWLLHAGLAFFVLAVLGTSTGAVLVARELAARPDAPVEVDLSESGALEDGTWATLRGLQLECDAPPLQAGRTHRYRLAGRDGEGVPMFVTTSPDPCPDTSATGTIHWQGGLIATDLERFAGAPRVRTLATYGGPANERTGVLSLLGIAAASALGAAMMIVMLRAQPR